MRLPPENDDRAGTVPAVWEQPSRKCSQPLTLRPSPATVCKDCCTPIRRSRDSCAPCGVVLSREGLIKAARLGGVIARSPQARAKQADKRRRHAAEVKAWNPADKPEWLTEEGYRERIQPLLKKITVPVLSSTLGLSQPYMAEIRAGRQVPHPRHWRYIAQLVGLLPVKCSR